MKPISVLGETQGWVGDILIQQAREEEKHMIGKKKKEHASILPKHDGSDPGPKHWCKCPEQHE
jgi:hypothetical protein